MRRTLNALLLVAAMLLAPLAAVQAQPARGAGPQSLPPPEVTLTTSDVQRLIKLLPEVAKVGAKYNAGGGGAVGSPDVMGQAMGQQPEAVQELQGVLQKHGLTLQQFAMQVGALISTYLALNPSELDKAMPSENHPQVQKVLNDPSVPDEQKQALRAQLQMALKNKDLMRDQLTQLATEANRAVVKPLLPEVKKAFDKAQAVAEGGAKAAPAPRKGPRK